VPFELERRYEALREEAAAVAAKAEPMAVEADAMNSTHTGMRELLRESELSRLTVPAAYGGADEKVDPVAVCIVREEFMRVSSHLDSLFSLQGIGSYGLAIGGSDELRERWLPAVAALEVLAALALTEPEAGSDLKSITTGVEQRGETLVLDGAKSFISNGTEAGFFAVLAREGDGYSMVLVPGDAAGLEVEPTPELIAPHILAELRFDGVEVPAGNRIGEPGRGFGLVLATLSMFRVSVAGAAIGLARAALEEATRHANRRHQFGRPLAQLGSVGEMLGDSWTELEMARLLTYRAAERAQTDPRAALVDSSMAKLAATETAGRIVDRAVQVMGRFGLIRDAKVERLYRQARPMRLYEGASEVLKLQIANVLAERAD
jgi:acyl-CoA dehydrogenase